MAETVPVDNKMEGKELFLRFAGCDILVFSVTDDQKDQKAGKGDGHVSIQVGEQQQGSAGDGRGGKAKKN